MSELLMSGPLLYTYINIYTFVLATDTYLGQGPNEAPTALQQDYRQHCNKTTDGTVQTTDRHSRAILPLQLPYSSTTGVRGRVCNSSQQREPHDRPDEQSCCVYLQSSRLLRRDAEWKRSRNGKCRVLLHNDQVVIKMDYFPHDGLLSPRNTWSTTR